ncbi:MAG: Tim44 domain-containing protein [Rhizobacter sp.]|nr:Tim44 domain-containing protein [Burkholderiales bacterium]
MFKSISIAIIAVALALGGAASVEAKKFGGGKSVGTQRSAPTTSPSASPTSAVPASAATAAPAAAAAAPKTGMAKWAGPLAGIAAGLGLGYLFSQMGGGASSMLMMVLLAGLAIGGLFLVARMFMRKQNPGMASPGGSITPSPYGAPQQRVEHTSYAGTGAASGAAVPLAAAASSFGIPADFDKAGFEANAKSQFMALQAANDKGDLDAVRDFATDDFYNQIAKDVAGGNKDATHVDELHAELTGIETERGQYWASVQFTGKMREDGMMMASDFRETWNLTKPVDGSKGWLLAGIQQA